jgi:hypothetical protein
MRLPPLSRFTKENAVSFLTKTFFKEHDEVMLHFNPSEQLELTEHFIQMMDCLSAFAHSLEKKLEPKHTEEYLAAADVLLIKYGSKFKPYTDKYFVNYFILPLLLIVKEYYTEDEVRRGEAKPLQSADAKALAFICKAKLFQNRIVLLTSDAHKVLNQPIATEATQIKMKESMEYSKDALDLHLVLMIKEQLLPFKTYFNKEADYHLAVQAIAQFFYDRKPYSGEVLFVKGGIIRKLAYALGEIWRSTSNEIISVEYLMLYIRLFSIFNKNVIDETNVFSNNLYKYSISKT